MPRILEDKNYYHYTTENWGLQRLRFLPRPISGTWQRQDFYPGFCLTPGHRGSYSLGKGTVNRRHLGLKIPGTWCALKHKKQEGPNCPFHSGPFNHRATSQSRTQLGSIRPWEPLLLRDHKSTRTFGASFIWVTRRYCLTSPLGEMVLKEFCGLKDTSPSWELLSEAFSKKSYGCGVH